MKVPLELLGILRLFLSHFYFLDIVIFRFLSLLLVLNNKTSINVSNVSVSNCFTSSCWAQTGDFAGGCTSPGRLHGDVAAFFSIQMDKHED